MNLIRTITGLEIYSRKQRWKLFLLVFAALIVGASLYYTDILVKKIAEDERQKVWVWADAIQNRAALVKVTNELFEEIKTEERKRVELVAKSLERLIEEDLSVDLTFYMDIVEGNTTIPLVHVEDDGTIVSTQNLDKQVEEGDVFEGELRAAFGEYPPISLTFEGITQYIYYRDSRLFAELREILDDLIDSFFSETVINAANVPVFVTDSAHSRVIAHGNVDVLDPEDPGQVEKLMRTIGDKNPPITIELPVYGECHVYYTNSFLLTQLRYYPVFQFLIIGVFLIVAYILFSMARNAEQNQVWVGMSKETAHQLGTPLSSLLAWVELLKAKGVDGKTMSEISKDVERLENITERFSKIGSPPKLIPADVVHEIRESVNYMKNRTSRKLKFELETPAEEVFAPLNPNLFGWVIENIIKNAIDAMNGSGQISLEVIDQPKNVIIDITDQGKGIPPSRFKSIFNPGFTSKKRGWGLGLSLSKRIIENYHKGKLFVKHSEVNKGTTFRIVLKKQP